MTIQMIPLNQLVPSTANVRKTGAAIGIEELAASIDAHGLLQNLQVRPALRGKFEVVAGRRRLAALKLLVKQKKKDKDAEIPCHVLDTEDAGEISLVENTLRLPMHPADQFEAFHALTLRGKGMEEIAARFGVSVAVVRQRLKLAAVSPRLMEVYRADEMSLDQLMAFTVTDDHTAQETVWFESLGWSRGADAIRRALTAAHVEAHDRCAVFVGLDAYKEAGGDIALDLFKPEHEGYLTDVALLDRLVSEKLESVVAPIRAEGWHWVAVMPSFDYAERQNFKRISPETSLSPEAQAELDQLEAELDALVEQDGEADDDMTDQIDALTSQIEAITAQAQGWSLQDRALSGVVVALERDGSILIERGLVRAEDAKKVFAVIEGGKGNAPAPKPSGLSASLVEDLTAERTAALRAVLMDNQKVALAALAHSFALTVFYPHAYQDKSCLDIRLTSRNLVKEMEDEGRKAEAALTTRHQQWESVLPESESELFGWLLVQDEQTVLTLITYCTALSVDAVQAKQGRADCPRLAHADALAASVGLDMAQWWEPTKTRYLGRVSKALILEAVAEGVSPQAAENLANLKKEALAIRAQERLQGKGWLPPLLRSPVPAFAADEPMLEAAE